MSKSRSCGKVRYRSRPQALQAMRGMRWNMRQDPNHDPDYIPRRVYPCNRCHGWHMTHETEAG